MLRGHVVELDHDRHVDSDLARLRNDVGGQARALLKLNDCQHVGIRERAMRCAADHRIAVYLAAAADWFPFELSGKAMRAAFARVVDEQVASLATLKP